MFLMNWLLHFLSSERPTDQRKRFLYIPAWNQQLQQTASLDSGPTALRYLTVRFSHLISSHPISFHPIPSHPIHGISDTESLCMTSHPWNHSEVKPSEWRSFLGQQQWKQTFKVELEMKGCSEQRLWLVLRHVGWPTWPGNTKNWLREEAGGKSGQLNWALDKRAWNVPAASPEFLLKGKGNLHDLCHNLTCDFKRQGRGLPWWSRR